jgi:hypothetical protein
LFSFSSSWRHLANIKHRCAIPRTLASAEYFPSCELIRYLEIQSHTNLEGTPKQYVKYGYIYQTSTFSATPFNTIHPEKHVCNLLPRDDKEVVDLQLLFSQLTMDL